MQRPLDLLLVVSLFACVACSDGSVTPPDPDGSDPDPDGTGADAGDGADGGATTGLAFPAWLAGTWQESATDGYTVTFSATDLVITLLEGGAEKDRISMAELDAADRLTFEVTVDDGNVYDYVASVDEDALWFNDSFVVDPDFPRVAGFSRNGAFDGKMLNKVP